MNIDVGVLEALQKYQQKRPAKKDDEDQLADMKELLNELSDVCNMQSPSLDMENIDGSFSGNSSVNVEENEIVLRGKLSIITLLHEFAHLYFYKYLNHLYQVETNYNVRLLETLCRVWSINYFSKVYPKTFAKLRPYHGDSTVLVV